VLLVAPSASQARARAPSGLFGAVFDGIASTSDTSTTTKQYRLMRRAGVQTVRRLVTWSAIEPMPNVYNFFSLDEEVAAASRNHLHMLPVVIYTPQWASSASTSLPDYKRELYPPKRLDDYGRFLRVLIRRYGPRGSFWKKNPHVHKVPWREYQIWNEPSARYFWAPRNYPTSYTRLLKNAYRWVHKSDRHAKVVTAGLASFSSTGPNWRDLDKLYKHGARRYFDVVAIHPFAPILSHVVRIIKKNRAVMRRHHDSKKPIYLTELSFLASKGKIPKRNYLGLEVSAGKQRKLLTGAYKSFIRDRKLRVKKAFWYTWASVYEPAACRGDEPSFQYTGLMQVRPCTEPGRDAPLTFKRMKVLSTYSRVAHRYGR
jgi:polysaccharide biosynthesis protein PslG